MPRSDRYVYQARTRLDLDQSADRPACVWRKQAIIRRERQGGEHGRPDIGQHTGGAGTALQLRRFVRMPVAPMALAGLAPVFLGPGEWVAALPRGRFEQD